MTGTRIKVRNLERWRDRHGTTRLYYRVGHGPRTRLKGPEGSPEFWEDYRAAAKQGPQAGGSDTLGWLVQHYYTSAAYKVMRASTRRVRKGILENFCAVHGHKRFAQLQPHHLRQIRDGMTDRPDAANSLLKALRQVFKYAVAYDHLESNPVLDVERLKSRNKDGLHAWAPQEIEAFEAAHPVGTRARLALALLLCTGQRRGDVVGMGRQHVRDGWMTVTQQKTGKRLAIPILTELQRIIDASETGDLTYLVTSFGKPYTAAGFGNWFRVQCNKAGLPQCSAHGLRKACASRLAELGFSTQEIKSITGHESLSEVERYTKAADQKRLAARVRDGIENKNGPPNPKPFSHSSQTLEKRKADQ